VGIHDLADFPSALPGRRQALLVIQRIDGEGLAAVRAGDEVIEVPPGVGGPDPLYDHRRLCLSEPLLPSVRPLQPRVIPPLFVLPAAPRDDRLVDVLSVALLLRAEEPREGLTVTLLRVPEDDPPALDPECDRPTPQRVEVDPV